MQTVPYDDMVYDTANQSLNLVSIGYNGLSNPIITSWGSYGHEELYEIDYHSDEITGLRSRFGYQNGFSLNDQIESGIATITAEILNSYIARRQMFNKASEYKLDNRDFGFLFLVPFRADTEDFTGVATSPRVSPPRRY